MSPAHLLWLATGSTLRPMIFVLRLANSGSRRAMYPSSVVHTGVKSLGCEKRMAQPSPIHWGKSILPWVVSAVKLGATELMRIDTVCCSFQVFKNFSSRTKMVVSQKAGEAER